MSGRDWKKLVTHHRKKGISLNPPQDKNGILTTVSGLHFSHKSYSEVDYDTILKSIKYEREKGKQQLMRVKTLAGRSKERKEASFLNEHQTAWRKKYNHLDLEVMQCQHNLEQCVAVCTLDGSLNLNGFLMESIELNNNLLSNRVQFVQDVCGPVRLLRRKLHFLKQKKDNLLPSFKQEILYEIERVQQEHKRVWSLLEGERSTLETQMKPIKEMYTIGTEVTEVGVAKEVWSLDCPNDKLRQLMAEEFIKLDNYYQFQLKELQTQFKDCLLLVDGGWKLEEDRLHFELILEQYPHGVNGYRSLYIDRMLREMSHKTRDDIVSYETWFNAINYYNKQRSILLNSWKKKRLELVEKTKIYYTEVCREWKRRKMLREDREKHDQICKELAEKVSEWRQQCQALQEAETKLAMEQLANQKALIEEEEKRQSEKRQRIKEQLELYHSEKEQQRQDEILQQKERMEKMREALKDQARRDKERTNYREHLFKLKLAEKTARSEALEEENRRRDKRLENIRQLVRIEADHDPQRLSSDTEASKAHSILSQHYAEVEIHKPLFPLHSFASDKILSDKRIKVASALREAGLLSTDYARRVLAAVPPPLPPRPDQSSSLFKYNIN